MNDIITRIKQERKKRGLKQSDIAEKMNIQRVTVTNIENGKNRGNFEMLKQICEILEVSADYILFGKEKNKKNNLNDEGMKLLREYEEFLEEKYPKEKEYKEIGNL